MSFADYLRDAMERHSIPNSDLAKHFGVSSQAVSQWRSGANNPSSARIEEVRAYIEERASKTDRVRPVGSDAAMTSVVIPGNYVPIPTLDVRAGMGSGGIIDGSYLGAPRYFEEGFVANELRAKPEDLCLVEVEGQSMEPLLRHGDTVIVDRRKINIGMEGIFVLFDGDYVVCKMVERVHGSEPPAIRIRSINQEFQTYEVEAERCQILGRVVWFARRL